MGKLLPRLELGPALRRLRELEAAVIAGEPLESKVVYEDAFSAPNPTGGAVIKPSELREARLQVLSDLGQSGTSHLHRDERSRRLLRDAIIGRALDEHLPLIPSDAGHNEVWVYLSLMTFPDVVLTRWPLSDAHGGRKAAKRALEEVGADTQGDLALPQDRWIGLGGGRDRNYLRSQWRRWRLLGALLLEGDPPLGEDELVGLTERSSMARNADLIAFCARTVLSYEGIPGEERQDRFGQPLSRSDFARLLGRAVVLNTGPRVLDILPPPDLARCVQDAAASVMPPAASRFRDLVQAGGEDV